MTEILLLLTAYFLGSIPTSYLVVQIFHGRDIRQVGTTNPGMMNVWDNIGLWSALLVGIGDIGKGSLAIGLGIWLGADPYLLGAVALTVVLGHDFSVFLRFHGGNGTAPAVGVVMALLPISTVYVLLIVVAAYFTTRRKRACGILGMALAPSLGFLLGYDFSSVLISLMVLSLAVIKIIRFEGFTADRMRQPVDQVLGSDSENDSTTPQ